MAYGGGSLYQRGRIWWISYMVRGRQVNESSKSSERKDAANLLKKRMGEIAAGRAVSGLTVTVPDLLERLRLNYIETERRSIADLKGKIACLRDRFRGVRASDFGTTHIARMKESMKGDKASNATINRYLAVLRRAFTLADRHDPPLVGRVPHFEMLPEDNARTGFLTDSQYSDLKAWLPEHLRGLLIFGYHLGMRKTALKNLRRDHVDWPNRVIRSEVPRRAKKQGRVLPIYGDMGPWLEMQMVSWPSTPKCHWIFHLDGVRIGDFRKSWDTACKAANVPELLFHDLRRSAVRNMERAGVPRSQAMAMTGHKTDSIYSRYAIVSEQDIKAAGEKLGRLLEAGRPGTTTEEGWEQ
jgi:integrase